MHLSGGSLAVRKRGDFAGIRPVLVAVRRGWSRQVPVELSQPTRCWMETTRYPINLALLVSLALRLELPLSELMRFPVCPRAATQ